MKTKISVVLGFALCVIFAASLYAEDGNESPAPAGRVPVMRVMGSISEKYEPVRFDHPKHVAIAKSCAACHHHGKGDTSSCRECHGLNARQFRKSVVNSFVPCSSCHGPYDRENPAMPGLKVAYHTKCFECHRGMADLGTDPKGCTQLCHAKKQRPGVKARR